MILGGHIHLTTEAVHCLALEIHQVEQLVYLRSKNLNGEKSKNPPFKTTHIIPYSINQELELLRQFYVTSTVFS